MILKRKDIVNVRRPSPPEILLFLRNLWMTLYTPVIAYIFGNSGKFVNVPLHFDMQAKLRQLREMKEVTVLYLLFLACCAPLQVYRAWTMSRVSDCDLTLNILVLSAALFR